MATVEAKADPQVQQCVRVIQDLVADYEARDFAVRFWEGTTWSPDPVSAPSFTIVLNHEGSLRRMFWPPRPLTTGQAFVYDDFNVEGDMIGFARLCGHLANLKDKLSFGQRLGLGWKIWNLPKLEKPRVGRQAAQLTGRKYSRERDRQAISYHYDMSNEFYEAVLDPAMQYTNAVYEDPCEDVAVAQERKIDLICRKLRMKPGERYLDIGCGWGGQVVYAAKHYGVHAVGVTLSTKQAEWGNAATRKAGVQDRCRLDLVDYRDIDERQPFDKISTVEATEHFGAANLPAYFAKCWRLLRPGGSLFIQAITFSNTTRTPAARDFSQHYVFPDGELSQVSTLTRLGEEAGFEVRDVECFRESYVLALKAWLNTLEAKHDELVRLTDEATYRVFRLYFAGACIGFEKNMYSSHQILFSKPDGIDSGYPLTSQDWYKPRG